jgi:molecular chaperone GrpE
MVQPEENNPMAGEAGTEDLEKALAEARAKADSCLASWQRAQADFINYKRRMEQEKAELSTMVAGDIIGRLLPVVDDFERALRAIPAEHGKDSWVEGVRLIERKLKNYLEAQGVIALKALNEPFNPYLHEAVRQAAGREGIIIEELEKGYSLRDKLIRPAKVAVGNGEEENAKKEA